MTEAAPACPEMFALDTLAQEGPAERGFLRSAWFAAGDTPADRVLIARDTQDAPLAGLAFDHRRIGPLSVKQVAGSYWPFRGIPLAPRANRESLARALRALRSEIGRIWRIGPLRADDPANTDELRIDLDPSPGVDFAMLREAAEELRSLLDGWGIRSYPKTSGNRGLHVYVRVAPHWDSYDVRGAAVVIARALARHTAAWDNHLVPIPRPPGRLAALSV